MAGFICPKHQQWWSDGECRWCEGLREEREVKAHMERLKQATRDAVEKTAAELGLLPKKYSMILGPLQPVRPVQPAPPTAAVQYMQHCACQQYLCTAAVPAWLDYLTGVRHAPSGCMKP